MTDSTSGQEITISPVRLHESLQKNEPFLLFDLRIQDSYNASHIKGAVHAVCDTKAKETILPKIPKSVKVVLVDEDGTLSKDTAKMMREFGLDASFLEGGMKNWKYDLVSGSTPTSLNSIELWNKLKSNKDVFLLDVRDTDEFSDFKIPGSVNIPLKEVFRPENMAKISKEKEIVTICPHGNRAMIATFALARNGISSHVLEGGLAGWSQVLNYIKVGDNPSVFQIEKIGKGCLSHIVVSKGEAIVIDPLYPPQKYQEIAQKEDFKIIKILDTHQHADHISAAADLSKLTATPFYESANETWERNIELLNDGDLIEFGNSKLKVVHTPGHTPGSLCFLVDEKYVFTGDILFIESIGRPDLRDKAEEFAKDLYDSLHNKLLKLPPDTIVFPTHHGLSVKPENGKFSTTIEKAKMHSILQLSKDEFVKKVVSVTLPRPMNYQKIIQINKGSLPLVLADVPDLELGPNRCSIEVT